MSIRIKVARKYQIKSKFDLTARQGSKVSSKGGSTSWPRQELMFFFWLATFKQLQLETKRTCICIIYVRVCIFDCVCVLMLVLVCVGVCVFADRSAHTRAAKSSLADCGAAPRQPLCTVPTLYPPLARLHP